MGTSDRSIGGQAKRLLQRAVVEAERRWDATRLSRAAEEGPPQHFRITTYFGHGAGDRVVVRGRVLDDEDPPSAVEGEGTWAAVRRTSARFLTHELPGVRLRIRIGGTEAETVTDEEGYFDLRVETHLDPIDGPWVTGEVELGAPYRGLTDPHTTPVHVRVPQPGAAFGVISDVDDTILYTGAQRALGMVLATLTGSSLTRTPMEGSPELYRALAGHSPARPFFYVSSSPWNLHGFLTAFLEHRGFPLGPLLLRDLLGGGERRSHGSHKHRRIDEVLALHPRLPFVLIGDSGQHDPEIYADVVRRYPGRIVAVYIREVRLDPDDRRVESITDAWDEDVPFVLAHDSAALARHAATLGLLSETDVETVEAATT